MTGPWETEGDLEFLGLSDEPGMWLDEWPEDWAGPEYRFFRKLLDEEDEGNIK